MLTGKKLKSILKIRFILLNMYGLSITIKILALNLSKKYLDNKKDNFKVLCEEIQKVDLKKLLCRWIFIWLSM